MWGIITERGINWEHLFLRHSENNLSYVAILLPDFRHCVEFEGDAEPQNLWIFHFPSVCVEKHASELIGGEGERQKRRRCHRS